MMASSDNLASLEPWLFRTSFPDSWISEAYSRDTETLTRALQKSLSSNTNSTETFPTDTDTFQQQFYVKDEQLFPTVSDPDTMVPKQQRRNNAAIISTSTTNGGRIAKRKSRASKRSPTTFIAADPSNFRQMVQQVTGIRFGDAPNVQQFTTTVLKPAPQRLGNRIPTYAMPTLDTSSAFLLDNNHTTTPPATTTSQEQPVEGGGTGLDFATFHNFPTLESWRVM